MMKLLLLSFLFVSCNVVQMVENGETQIDDTFFQTGDNGNFYCPGPMVCSPSAFSPTGNMLKLSWIEPTNLNDVVNSQIAFYHFWFYTDDMCESSVGARPSVPVYTNFYEDSSSFFGLSTGTNYYFKIFSCDNNIASCNGTTLAETACLGPFMIQNI